MFSRHIQQRVRQFVTMIVRPLAGLGVTPNTLTVLGLILSILTAVIIAQGLFLAGGLLVLFAGIFDMFDGAMARVRNASTTFGAFFDSTLDRYSESIILFGLLFYALRMPVMQDRFWPFRYEQSWMITLVFIAAVGSFMVSYAKARAEGLGLECKTGLLARPERVVILAIGLLTGAVIWALVILAIFSNVTAIERIVHVWRATRQPVAMTEVRNFSSDGHMNETNNSSVQRQVPIGTNEGREPSVPSGHTTMPPFNGGVQQD
ncbi:MAG TPA: CDP-alcohol phosphatidyltransferase family protein [Ktedonobacteraceae bacterium]